MGSDPTLLSPAKDLETMLAITKGITGAITYITRLRDMRNAPRPLAILPGAAMRAKPAG
jgi:hypothetical protein